MLFQNMPGQMREDGRDMEVTLHMLSIMSTNENMMPPAQIYISWHIHPSAHLLLPSRLVPEYFFNHLLNEKHVLIYFMAFPLLFPMVTASECSWTSNAASMFVFAAFDVFFSVCFLCARVFCPAHAAGCHERLTGCQRPLHGSQRTTETTRCICELGQRIGRLTHKHIIRVTPVHAAS